MELPPIDRSRHPIEEADYANACRARLDRDGALVLRGFVTAAAVARIVDDCAPREPDAFYAGSTHNVWLTPPDTALGADHVFNRQVVSSKGLIADDQIPVDSALRQIYDDPDFRTFLARVLGVDAVHPYADDLSSVNVHFAAEGMELGWHFDNSSFAVTLLLQAPEGGGAFEYVPSARRSRDGDLGFERVAAVFDGTVETDVLEFAPGDLVVFRGRDALHRVTPTTGSVTRILSVLAFNDEPGIGLSDSALETFYGRGTSRSAGSSDSV